MKFLVKKILPLLFLVVYGLSSAQNTPGTPCFPGEPCERPAAPIDMYVYVLVIAAILMIAYFAKKYKAQKI
ncbi:signal peptidase [Chryseobacterium aahli]|uniref:signal peptidase n=1 Tax=Chryseobacterium aahli TaxID=1278643 RepID=UPI001F5FFD03|nr:signal peptidase [Chryseobacterium aahli]MCI3937717.1 signal peptidase [Chryseobacterium aahli]